MSQGPSRERRKAIQREYKESYRPTGVYRLVNHHNQKILVGSSVNLPAMFNRLRMELDTGGHLMHPALQKDWTQHAGEGFEFEILEELEAPKEPGWDPSEDLEALLQIWLDELQPFEPRGYNRVARDLPT